MPRLAVALTVLLALGCHPRASSRPAPTTGGIAGLVHDRVTGEPVAALLAAHGIDSLEAHGARTDAAGHFHIDGLPPGTYNLVAAVPGTSLQFTGIPVVAGRVTAFDVGFDPAMADVPPAPYAAVVTDAIELYSPPDLDPAAGRLGGVVTDTVTRERVPGVVVVATSPAAADVLTVVTDDSGTFVFPDLPPGTYDLSAFYQVARRGQIEVKRTGIDVPAGKAARVPLFVELSGTE